MPLFFICKFVNALTLAVQATVTLLKCFNVH